LGILIVPANLVGCGVDKTLRQMNSGEGRVVVTMGGFLARSASRASDHEAAAFHGWGPISGTLAQVPLAVLSFSE
jgi:hypothetical protein